MKISPNGSDRIKIIRMYAEGLSPEGISAQLGVLVSAVERYSPESMAIQGAEALVLADAAEKARQVEANKAAVVEAKAQMAAEEEVEAIKAEARKQLAAEKKGKK